MCQAGRKTEGKVNGELLVNGAPVNFATFNRVAGYVEQIDSHEETATVYEAIRFRFVTCSPFPSSTTGWRYSRLLPCAISRSFSLVLVVSLCYPQASLSLACRLCFSHVLRVS